LALLVGLLPAAPAAAASSLYEARIEARELLADLHHGFVDVEELRLRANTVDQVQRRAAQTAAEGEALDYVPLVGTWVIHVPEGGGAPAFDALHTFEVGGTFVETSSLLATLTEGPAHGSWRTAPHNRRHVALTFELFAFEDGQAIGRIRVRARLVVKGNELQGDTVVDLILPDGELISAIGSGPFTGTRMAIVAP
jgi:hypothetical protein